MFDETYLHDAKNNTAQNRFILFLEVKPPVYYTLQYVLYALLVYALFF